MQNLFCQLKYGYAKKANTLMLIVVVSAIFTACHRNKNISKTTTKPTPKVETTTNQPSPPSPPSTNTINGNVAVLLKHLKSNELPFTELSMKLKTKITTPELNQSFTTNIRWKKNEKIWMSMSIIGIEGARVLITKDSIKIMDKINNRYILKPLSYISQKALVNLSYADIENILLGQLVFTDTLKAKYTENAANITLNADATRFLTNVMFDKNTKTINSISVNDKQNGQTIDAQYANYQQQAGKLFSMDRELKVKKGIDFFEMIAKIQNIEIKQNLEYPFYINPSFKIE